MFLTRGMDNITGIVYSFMFAGAAKVISAINQIDDEATVFFMDNLYKKVYLEGKDFRDALYEIKNEFRKGKFDIIDPGNMRMHSRPFYWAGFVLYE